MMLHKAFVVVFLLCTLVLLKSQAQVSQRNDVKQIIAAADSIQSRLTVEKVYLHTDKPYYNLGDTLWFKAYILDGAFLSATQKSGLLYVELADTDGDVVRRISVRIQEGLAYAQITLSNNIFREGSFTLRAYTNWQQNFNGDYVFSTQFYLGRPNLNNWLVNSRSQIQALEGKEVLNLSLDFSRADASKVVLREVELQIKTPFKTLYRKEMQTSLDGSLEMLYDLKDKTDGRNVWIEVKDLRKGEGNQVLKIPLTISRNRKIDLQFMPEGGHLVGGIKSVIGFKAIGEDGRGVEVEGNLYDSKGQPVAEFRSMHKGMGKFEFIPLASEVYTATIRDAHTQKVYPFPAVNNKGTVLRVADTESADSVEVEISSSDNLDARSNYCLIGTARGVVCYAQSIESFPLTRRIDKKLFPTGIVRFTVLQDKAPLNERIVYINHQDQLQISVKSGRNNYGKRDSISLILQVKDHDDNPVKGMFSLAVTDDAQVRADTGYHRSIVTQMLIVSDLKGNIEDAGYYLSNSNSQTAHHLDLLMLTQGWVAYNWKDVFSPAKLPAFAAEKEINIGGKVFNVLMKPVPGARVLLSSQKPALILTTEADNEGSFRFDKLPQVDSMSYFIYVRTKRGHRFNFGEIQLDKFRPPYFENSVKPVMPWYVSPDTAQLLFTQKNTSLLKEKLISGPGIQLNEVRILGKKVVKGSFNLNGPGMADMVFDEKDIRESGVMDMYEILKQKLPGFQASMRDNQLRLLWNGYRFSVKMDGGPLPLWLNENATTDELIEDLKHFKLATFKGIEVMYSRQFTIKYTGNPLATRFNQGGKIRKASAEAESYGADFLSGRHYIPDPAFDAGIIEITTTNGVGWYRNLRPDFATYRPVPFMAAKQFYSPKYTVKDADLLPDYRSTIYWAPDIVTDEKGEATLSFYSSDLPGSYTVSVEGADLNGNLGTMRVKLKPSQVGDLNSSLNP